MPVQEVEAAKGRASRAEVALAEAQEQVAQQLQSQSFSLEQLQRDSREAVRSLEEERDSLAGEMAAAQVRSVGSCRIRCNTSVDLAWVVQLLLNLRAGSEAERFCGGKAFVLAFCSFRIYIA